jgi:hypothetical protein
MDIAGSLSGTTRCALHLKQPSRGSVEASNLGIAYKSLAELLPALMVCCVRHLEAMLG